MNIQTANNQVKVKTQRRKATDYVYRTVCECCKEVVAIEQHKKDQLYAKNHECVKVKEIIKTAIKQFINKDTPKDQIETIVYETSKALVFKTTGIPKANILNLKELGLE